MTETLLQSQIIIVPYEDIGGVRHVSAILSFHDKKYMNFTFVDDENRYLGPVAVQGEPIDGETVKSLLEDQDFSYEAVAVSAVHMATSHFLIDGEVAHAIEEIRLVDVNGRMLRLSRGGAIYPYGLVLRVENPTSN